VNKLLSWYFGKLSHRLVGPSLLLGILAVFLLSLISYFTVRNILEKSISHNLEVAVDLQNDELNRWVEDQKTTIVFISRAPFVRERVADLLSRDKDHPYYQESYRELSEYLYSYIKNFKGLREIMLLSNHGGEVIYSTSTEHEGESWALDSFFLEGKEALYIQGVYAWRQSAQPTITIARPLLDALGEKEGVLAVHLNLERMQNVISHPGAFKGEIYLVDKFKTFLNADRFGREDFPRGVQTVGIDRVVAGEEGTGHYLNYQGVPVVGYYRWIPDLEVGIVAEIPRELAYASAKHLGLLIGSLGLALIVTLVLGHVFFARRISRPLGDMARMAQQVASGDFSIQIPVLEQDETGVLAKALNQMVSHLKQVYEEMSNTAENFKTIFNLNPSSIVVQRFDNGKLVQVNEGFCQMFDVTTMQALGRSAEELGIWHSNISRLRLAVLLRRKGGVIDYESHFVRGNGDVFAGIIYSRVIELSGEKHVVSIMVDLSDIRRTENELRDTSERLQLLVQRMPIACIAWNNDFTVSLWNPAAEQVFGYPAAAAVGKHAYELVVPKSVQAMVEPIWGKLLAGDSTAHSVNENITSDGRLIVCDWTNTTLKDEHGNAIGVISMVRDVTEEKKAQDSLHYQKELLQTILDAIPAPIFFKGADLLYKGCNQAFCDALGLSHDSIVGRSVHDITGDERAKIYEDADKDLLRKGGVQIYEAKFPHADGSERDVVFHKAVFKNPDGSIGGMVGNMLDVTEIRKAEAELAESELNYREIFNASSEAIIIRDLATGKILDVNQSMLDMYGYSFEEAIATTIDDLSSGEPPYTIDKAYENLTRAKSGEFRLFEWRAKKKDGTRFWVEISLQKSTIRGESRVIAVIRDITQRKEVEQAHRESEERFHLLLEHAADALFLHDAEGNILTVNQRSCDWLGYHRDELVEMNISDFEKGNSSDQLRNFWKSLETGKSSLLEGQHTRKDGSTYPVDVNVVKFVFQDADFFLALARDVSERRATEQELERYRDRLEELVQERTKQLEEAQEELVLNERLAVLGQLTATVSHELRNPLGTVKNAIHILGRLIEQGDADRIEKTLDLAGRNVNRCDGIINELLDYTRQQEWTPVKIDLGHWLQSLLDEQVVPDDIEVNRNWNKGIVANCEPERLRRAVLNIFTNGIQALQEISSRRRVLRLRIDQEEDRVVLSIADNGPGIDNQTLERIFEPMFSTKNFGVGLGMPIVKNIMEEHAGGIEIDSSPGKGTTVSLWLPRN